MIRTMSLQTRREILIRIRDQYQKLDWLGKSKLLEYAWPNNDIQENLNL